MLPTQPCPGLAPACTETPRQDLEAKPGVGPQRQLQAVHVPRRRLVSLRWAPEAACPLGPGRALWTPGDSRWRVELKRLLVVRAESGGYSQQGFILESTEQLFVFINQLLKVDFKNLG